MVSMLLCGNEGTWCAVVGQNASLVFKTELIIKNSSMYSLFPLYRVVWKLVVLSTDGDI